MQFAIIMTMATITIRKFPEHLLERLKEIAKDERRSLNQELIYLLEEKVMQYPEPLEKAIEKQVLIWHELSGDWRPEIDVDAESRDIYKQRSLGRKVS